MRDGVLGVWVFPRGTDPGEMARVAMDMGRLPDLHVQLLTSTGETVTVQVVDGLVPLDATGVLYVQRRGTYELLRREPWPGGRVLLTLAAWPRR